MNSSSPLIPRILRAFSILHHHGLYDENISEFVQPILRPKESRPDFDLRLKKVANNFELNVNAIADAQARKVQIGSADWLVRLILIPPPFRHS